MLISPEGSEPASMLGMNLLESAIGSAAPVLSVVIVAFMLGLAGFGWWVGASKGRGKR